MINLSCYYGFCDERPDCPYFFKNYMKNIPRPEKVDKLVKKVEETFDVSFNIDDPGHAYTLSNGQKIQFIKKEGDKVANGVTNEEIIMVLLDRIQTLDERLPCEENMMVEAKLRQALQWLNIRTLVRVNQKVEGTEKPHDPMKAQEYLKSIKSNTL